MKEHVGVDDRDPEPIARQPDLSPYAGLYTRPFADVAVAVEQGRLMVQSIQKRGFPNASAPVPPPGPKVPYSFYADGRAVAVEGPQKGARIEFIRSGDGMVGWVRVGGRIHRKTGATS